MLDKASDKNKMMIRIEKMDDTKILIQTDDKLLDDVTLKNVVILIICAFKNDDSFYSRIFLD